MSEDLVLPIIATVGWLILVASGLASHRLGWGQLVTMALVWIAIFGGLFLIIEWFMTVRDRASGFV
jgi:hypothetical protein